MTGRISEIFASIQGEGIYLGEKQIFVRFFGCNLTCRFCDTRVNNFMEYAPEDLLERIKLFQDDFHSISFTGGEPLLQKDFLREILKLTSGFGFRNYLETNGTLPDELKEVIDDLDIVAMDLKLPSSTFLDNFWDAHRRFFSIASRREVFLKAVICSTTNEEDIRRAISLIKEINKSAVLVLQPNSYEIGTPLTEKLEKFRNICKEEKVASCIIPQIHKMIGIR